MSFLPFSVSTCAKINLGLRVLRRRPDGYHDIESIFVAIDLADILHVEPNPALVVECRPEVTLAPEQNIVHKACRLYGQHFPDDNSGAKITVEKRIPTGAGLGGGSGDAAAALLAMARLNDREINETLLRELEPLAAECGSDVPFFLRGGVALVTGRGEHVAPLNITFPWTVLVVCPGIHVNTAAAYSTLGITSEYPSPNLSDAFTYAIDNNTVSADIFTNDFERAVFPQQPFLAEIKRRIQETGALFASMSGSGSSVYGLFENEANAALAAEQLADLRPYICAPVTAPFRPL
ncbi:MAG: 4-(cytidine 5'-diphospho)-2-C-methyl-D-erythritol kinase [Candidatus Kapabacteria bacterium]|nr:4-(cytidine 5'-diphospho)-2-C-methyl-D-erythritol kinase [Candidatus Kapabacteria bacterium]